MRKDTQSAGAHLLTRPRSSSNGQIPQSFQKLFLWVQLPHSAVKESLMPSETVPQARITLVASFPVHYFLENLAMRSDNSVLISALSHKEL